MQYENEVHLPVGAEDRGTAPALSDPGPSAAGDEPELPPAAYMVLAMIRDGFNTGYGIKQRLEGVASFFWSASYGQIYPELRRLEALGLIIGREAHVSGRLRREYALTPRAEEQLKRWLARPAAPSLWLRDEALLRMMLVDWDDRELTLKNLVRLRQLALARLALIRARTPERKRGQMIKDLGIRMVEATLSWCDDAEAALRQGPDGPGLDSDR